MSKRTKTITLPENTYDFLYNKLLPDYESLIQYVAHRYYDTSYISDTLDDRIQDGYISLFTAIKAFLTYKVEDAESKSKEELLTILQNKAKAYIKTTIWHVKAYNAKRAAIRYEISGQIYELDSFEDMDKDVLMSNCKKNL